MESEPLDYWREYFKTANTNIIDVIENAILVAASDRPNEFYSHRDRIAQRLFSSPWGRCVGCDRVGLRVPLVGEEDSELKEEENDGNSQRKERNNYCNDNAESLTEEIEEQHQTVGEVLRIKGVLLARKQDESNSALFDSLRSLKSMRVTVEILTATEIGKAVNALRKHDSIQIRSLAKTIIEGWRGIVDEWVNAKASILHKETTPESLNPSTVDSGEIPFPPLDEEALLPNPTDDRRNLHDSGEGNRNQEMKKEIIVEKEQGPMIKHQLNSAVDVEGNDYMRTCDIHKKLKPRDCKFYDDQNTTPNKEEFQTTPDGKQKTTQTNLQDKKTLLDDTSVQPMLKSAKRRLQDGYQRAKNAKKRRSIQFMDQHDIPKLTTNQKRPRSKPSNG